jgi:hypothetical protein
MAPRPPLIRMPEGPRPLASLVLLESSVNPVATIVTAECRTICFVFMRAGYES